MAEELYEEMRLLASSKETPVNEARNELEFIFQSCFIDKAKFKDMLRHFSFEPGMAPSSTMIRASLNVVTPNRRRAELNCYQGRFPSDFRSAVIHDKTDVQSSNNNKFGVRLRANREVVVKDSKYIKELNSQQNSKHVRIIRRWSRVVPLTALSHKKAAINYDFSVVRTLSNVQSIGSLGSDLQKSKKPKVETFEVEVELCHVFAEELDLIRKEVISSLDTLLRIMHGGMSTVCTEISNKSFQEYKQACETLYGPTTIRNGSSESLVYNLAANIATLERKRLVNLHDAEQSYVITPKLDGTRAQLYVDGLGSAYLMYKQGRELAFVPTGLVVEEQVLPRLTLLDGELEKIEGNVTTYRFSAFDVIFWNNVDKTQEEFHQRHLLFKKLPELSTDYLTVLSKMFVVFPIQGAKNYETCKKKFLAFYAQLKDSANLDGFVLQPSRGENSRYPLPQLKPFSATWMSVYKWKPHNTLDFVVHKQVTAAPMVDCERAFLQYDAFVRDGKKGNVKVPQCVRVYLSNGKPLAEDNNLVVHGCIVECQYDNEFNFWKPLRVRNDKDQPNSKWTYDSTMDLVKNPLELDEIISKRKQPSEKGSAPRLLAKINRGISNDLLCSTVLKHYENKTTPAVFSLLDLGSGEVKSGKAWVNMKLQGKGLGKDKFTVFALDLGDIEERSYRYIQSFNKDKHRREIISDYQFRGHVDFTKPFGDDLIPNNQKYNVVTCTFAIHYAFNTEQTLKNFLQNVLQHIKIGGIFIGSYMSKRRVLELIGEDRSSLTVLKPDGQVYYKLERLTPGSEALYGNAVDISFHGLYDSKPRTEYLIDLEDYQDVFKKYGLTMEQVQPDHVHNGQQELTKAERDWLHLHKFFVFTRRLNIKVKKRAKIKKINS